MASFVQSQFGAKNAIQFLKIQLDYNPHEEIYIEELYKLMEAEEFIKYVKPRLEKRPCLVEFHRFYQNALSKHEPEHDLLAEYKGLLEKEPDNGDLMYLAARVNPDLDEAKQYAEKSIIGDTPSPWGYYTLSFGALSVGNFEDAIKMGRMALKGLPENRNIKSLIKDSYLALRKYDDVIKIVREEQKKAFSDGFDQSDIYLVDEEIRYLTLKGNKAAAEKRIKQYSKRLEKDLSTEQIEGVNEIFQCSILFNAGDLEQAVQSAKKIGDESFLFVAHLYTGDFDKAEKEVGFSDEAMFFNRMLLYLAAAKKGDAERADRYFSEVMEEEPYWMSWSDRIMIDCLKGERTENPEYLRDLPFVPGQKSLYLTAMGTRFPEQKEHYTERIRQLNLPGSLSYYIINDIVEQW
jgi:tetratricopeptide (TPR) repeat protein